MVFSREAGRLLRTRWKDANELAEELYAILSNQDLPLFHNGPLTLTAPGAVGGGAPGSTQPPITVTGLTQGQPGIIVVQYPPNPLGQGGGGDGSGSGSGTGTGTGSGTGTGTGTGTGSGGGGSSTGVTPGGVVTMGGGDGSGTGTGGGSGNLDPATLAMLEASITEAAQAAAASTQARSATIVGFSGGLTYQVMFSDGTMLDANVLQISSVDVIPSGTKVIVFPPFKTVSSMSPDGTGGGLLGEGGGGGNSASGYFFQVPIWL